MKKMIVPQYKDQEPKIKVNLKNMFSQILPKFMKDVYVIAKDITNKL
jgi:hypothetical protein